MRIDRYLNKDYYKHKKHKYLKREAVGGYDLVKNPKTGHKTKAYRYKYTYAQDVSRNLRVEARRIRMDMDRYTTLRNKRYEMIRAQVWSGAGVKPSPAMTAMENEMLEILARLPRREVLSLRYNEALSDLERARSYGTLYSTDELRGYEEKVLQAATKLGMYHPRSRFWFKESNQKLLNKLKIKR